MLLNVENLSLTYDKKVLFKEASFRVLEGDRIGLIGPNGVGKSTLIKILCGDVSPDSGRIEFDKKIKVGYLDQYLDIDQTLPIFEYLKSAFKSFYDKEKRMNELLEEVKHTTDTIRLEKLIKSSNNLREELEYYDFYQLETKILKICKGLGITNYGLERKIKELSGGQKIKVVLAKLLLETPDLLILDEPTNFLDTVHIEWLVKYLKEYKGNFLIVSHNQEFLNEVVNCIIEIDYNKITRYKGNYKTYVEKKKAMEEQNRKDYESRLRQAKMLKDYIDKNKVKTSTARQAQSRQKALDKIDLTKNPDSVINHLNMYFNYQSINSQKFLEVKDLEIGYDKSLLPPISLTIKSGSHLAVTGFNGIGKSTFFKTLVGELKPICGSFKFVENAKIAYFEQEHNFDDWNISALQEIHNIYPSLTETDVRTNLAKCGLKGAVVTQPIKTLSGGEQSKLKLCKIMMIKSNVLILDEPTNHLDKVAREDLLKALKKYQGTIIFSSHDSDFIKELSTIEYSIEELLLS